MMHVFTNQDPFSYITKILDIQPQVNLFADDLPSTVTFLNWPGRPGSIDAVGVNSPYSATDGWSGSGCSAMRAAHIWPNYNQYISFDAEAANYGAGTSFTWGLACKIYDSAAQRNLMFLGASVANNQWRGLALNPSDLPWLLSNRSGSQQGLLGTLPFFQMGQSLVIASLTAAGRFRVWQRSAESGTLLLMDDNTVNMTGSLVCNKFTLGGAILAGGLSSHAPAVIRYAFAARGPAVDAAEANKLMDVMENQLGCPLPTPQPRASSLITVPSNIDRWFSGPLQDPAELPNTQDQVSGLTNIAGGPVTMIGRNYDLGNVSTSELGFGAWTIPAGSSPFTLLFNIKRNAGPFVSGANYNFLSSSNLAITSLVNAGFFRGHYNGVLYDSGYDCIANWGVLKRHSGMVRFDGTNLQYFVDDFNTPLASFTPGARANAAPINLATFNGSAGSWEHRVCDLMIASRALSGAEAEQMARAGRLHEMRLAFAGDSNISNFRRDFLTPCGESALWWQGIRHVFPLAGWGTEFYVNRGQSGQMINTPGAIAPVSLVADGPNLDAALDANYSNVGVLNIGTNDANVPTYGGDMTLALADLETYLDDRLATGKYVGFVAIHLPPSRIPAVDARVNTLNAGFDAFVTAGKLLATVPRASNDPYSDLYFLPQGSNNEPRHWTGYGNMINAQSLETVLRDVIPYYDP